ncbi:hypothetical protein GLOTRDRAFT_68598 [Gloeophyllum trabeum ATCC 11539]|uniref:DH domain-containing protein n=1 Tax=Gloeophyllum trabeum (strain ATCC 11539 / FP-39264 / Madison 617) TaxID=670483 RepID=S7QMN5_GLOTA|nr:uncharacterized protein GLOTRDRAFT_68598 [Gloeophyllum trabeum ATCC 11539]EPQ60718.1 hypothetical protein GLOTRDRAFT_68598 [Gloeophyllum trabeum ATCC 11539]
MNGQTVDTFKPLPAPARDEKLPPLPPQITDLPLPPPPPKIMQNDGEVDPRERDGRPGLRPPPIVTPAYGETSLGPGSSQLPLTPVSPSASSVGSAPSSPGREGRSKKSNPLVDLIETEKLYVDQLAGVIRKVAAAWSRNNLPPPELDGMFRSIEAVYKANRGLLKELNDIGTNPSSPKALGDLLMRWIDDLERPYTSYCNTYYCGLDDWPPVTSNTRLPVVLATFSAAVPPPLPPDSPDHPSTPPLWTLDQLFLLPKARLKYYRKLYGRLLKSTTAGRSDHKLLVGAVERLDKLMGIVDERAEMRPPGAAGQRESGVSQNTTAQEAQESKLEIGEDEVVIDMRTQVREDSARFSDARGSTSGSSSARGSSFSSGERLSRDTGSTSIDRGSTSTLSTPVTDLERRLAVDRVLDIFTMKPKQVRLQISPPNLTYTRELRFSGDVMIQFTPRATGVEVVHQQGHIFLLTDLFLICERILPDEQAIANGADMWLCYPPLAGKHLKVSEVPGSDTAVQVTILKKEVLTMRTESVYARDKLVAEMKECIDFASSVAPASKTPPPPVPPLRQSALSPTGSSGSSTFSRSPSAPPPSERVISPPASIIESPIRSASPSQQSMQSINRSMSNMSVTSPDRPSPGAPSAFPSFSPGQVMPPSRSTSINSVHSAAPSRGPSIGNSLPGNPRGFSPGEVMGPGPGPGQIMGPGPGPGYPMGPGPGPGQFRGPGPGPGQFMGPGMQGPPRPYPNGPPMGGQPYPPPPQQFPPGQMPPRGPPGPPGPYPPPQRPPSDPYSQGGPPGQLRKVASTPNMAPQFDPGRAPPVPPLPGGPGFGPRSESMQTLHQPQPRPLLPSALNARVASVAVSGSASFREPSPPPSPIEEEVPKGPVTSSVTANMKCKVFLQQHHAQWKSLGAARLKLYNQQPTNVKQLVVEADDKRKTVLISTIVLSDGVERVGKTGVAVELSDKGARTGIIYMIQLRNESAAQGLFDSLLAGSDRAAVGRG